MKRHLTLTSLAMLIASASALASPQLDPSITHQPKDNVINVYGPGGPDTALRHAAEAFTKKSGVQVNVIAGPESKWTQDAQKKADLIFGSSEQSMSAFVETYPFITNQDVEPVYLRRAVIAVPKGNPKNISGIQDLLDKPSSIVVTEGLGVYNTSGTGVWEDVAGRTGSLADVQNFREKIIAYAKGSGASFKAFQQQNADAWITWIHWPLNHADKVDYVEIEPERRIYRDLTLAKTKGADPQTQDFINFVNSSEGRPFFTREGWTR
ncbi:accessory colonization factor [Vibrio coralliilyticus]|uniref:Accessory colonization factor n=1 Tax=Vibrio coralliilyticus TaxID=190893 RepID=A0A837GDP7_9VIBR|nr:substrate-binding domain-containing protein [Vibrio coralliilyticus]KJY70888.1 accessory colonization factor [Vibrio coralliilyticus]QOU31127.1 substrate-binding domain-containing protein [Vibrio coralliilyticus]